MSIEATYCPEDNKIRLYSGRVDRETYERLREAGYKSTPKQSCDFVATWSLKAEDIAVELIEDGDEIGDEDQSPEDRAADRAERFAMYRDKRRREATDHADAFDAGPSTYGHQNAQRSERMAQRHDRYRTGAVSQWSKAEYWQARTAGVIRNALYKSDARTRRGRLLRLEKELRTIEKWATDQPEGSNGARMLRHWRNRVTYETMMLEAEGGRAAALEIEPGGLYKGWLIVKVNKSPETGEVVSVNVHSADDGEWDYRRRGNTLLLNIQRAGEKAYTPPTPETLAKLAEVTKKTKAKTKARNATAPKLINPTPESAQELCDLLNESRARWQSDKAEVIETTQAEYSANSKGYYSRYETHYVHTIAQGAVTCSRPEHMRGGQIIPGVAHCKIRTGPSGFVVVITDKPQKPLPLDEMRADIAARNDHAEILPKIPSLAQAMNAASLTSSLSAEDQETMQEARAHGLLYVQSLSQWSWSKEAAEYIRQHHAQHASVGAHQ